MGRYMGKGNEIKIGDAAKEDVNSSDVEEF